MLDTLVDTHRPRIYLKAFVLLATLGCGAVVIYRLDAGAEPIGTVAIALGAVVCSIWLFDLLLTRVEIFDEGFRFISALRRAEMSWDQVRKLTYFAQKLTVNFVPAGTHYYLTLEDDEGVKVHFGHGMARAEQLATEVVNRTAEPLLARAFDEYHRSVDLDFGAVQLNRDSGFRVKSLFRTREIPILQVRHWRIQEGRFYLFSIGDKSVAGLKLNKVPNVFVLLALLNSIYGPGRDMTLNRNGEAANYWEQTKMEKTRFG